jgi:hypothetical protein
VDTLEGWWCRGAAAYSLLLCCTDSLVSAENSPERKTLPARTASKADVRRLRTPPPSRADIPVKWPRPLTFDNISLIHLWYFRSHTLPFSAFSLLAHQRCEPAGARRL